MCLWPMRLLLQGLVHYADENNFMVAHRYLTGGAPEAVFMLAPLLLMLSQDPLLLRQLGERHRYAPPAAAIALYLTIAGAIEVSA